MPATRLARGIAVSSLMAFTACNTTPQEPAGTPVGEISQGLITTCSYLNPGPVIDFDKELVIRDVSVVDDPCRTSNNPSPLLMCPPSTVGVWTFKRLMREMAGSTPLNQFVAEWLHTFEVNQTINTFTYNARMPGFRNNFLDPWLTASGCAIGQAIVGPGACPALDLDKAPFRLLAITNRIDLSGCVGAPPGAGYDSGPGQGRFVFGFLGGGNSSGPPLQGTVIFEYEFPSSNNAFWWANQWHGLGSLALPSAAFNSALQAITDAFTKAGLEPGKPNFGNPVGQVRTNEIDFGGPLWQLREFTLQNTGMGVNAELLLNDTTKMTPDDRLNGVGLPPPPPPIELDAWLFNNAPMIANLDHTVPLSFFPWPPPAGPGPLPLPNPPVGGGNACLAGASDIQPGVIWDHSGGALAPMDRHHFAFTTCNGCHGPETQTAFTHIDVRPAGIQSNLSPFLAVSNAPGLGGNPAVSFNFPDPKPGTGVTLKYNEPWRRSCEMARLLAGDPCPYSKQNGAH